MGFTTGGEELFGDDNGLSPFGGANAIMDTPLGGRNLLGSLDGQKISAIGMMNDAPKESPFWDGGDNIFELQSSALYGIDKSKGQAKKQGRLVKAREFNDDDFLT